MASSSSPDPLGLNGFLAKYSHDEERHQRVVLGLDSPTRFADVVQGAGSLVDIHLRVLPGAPSSPSVSDCPTSTETTAPSQIFTEFSNPSTGLSGFSRAPSVTEAAVHLPHPPEPVDLSLDGGSSVLFCEFVGLGPCDASFPRHEFWPWVEHIEAEHLQHWLPESCRCWFCDDVKFKASPANSDRRDNFCQRMQHIHRHIVDGGCSVQHMRPDFDLLKHLYWHKLVDKTVYRWARQYEEGPTVPGTYAHDFIPPEQLEAAQRGQRVELKETRKEQREWKARQQERLSGSRRRQP